jgi:hypothetical protein
MFQIMIMRDYGFHNYYKYKILISENIYILKLDL